MRVLFDRYPREKWEAHANLGEMARFWLSRHAMFRELSGTIENVTEQFRAGRLPPIEFARQFVPRLQFVLDQLNFIIRSRIFITSRFSALRTPG